jgi:hypothetical protein
MARRPSKLDRILEEDGVVEADETAPSNEPVYRIVGDSKIPVARSMGSLWQSRRDQGIRARSNDVACWDEAIKYYEHDQSSYRVSRHNSSGNTAFSGRLNEEWTETENVVFSNASIMVPLLYPRNPHIKIVSETEVNEPLARAVERLVNRLVQMSDAPGINLKPKLRRTILTALLTNNAYVKIGWTEKTESSQAAMEQVSRLAERLANAKKMSEIREIEGQIMAMEERINLLSDAGPYLKTCLPQQLVVDPTSVEPDHSDANWMMEWDYLPTSYINAVYTTEDGKTVYEPTHILEGNKSTGVEDEVNNFTLIGDDADNKPEVYGYRTPAQLKAAEYCKVWWVWDKTTRRVYMFHDNNWKWPIWVWDDPLRLPRFFPYFKLWFHESPAKANGKGEVTYYLDQQDAINEINDEVRRARRWSRRNVFFNKNVISQDDVEQVLKGPDGTARGVDIEEGMKLDDAIMSIVPPALRFPELFNTESKFTAINRITGINDAMRGAQFKTNTTNKAIEFYNSNVEVRVDERKDLIEEFVAAVCWNIAILCLMRWDRENVESIVGPELSQAWQQMPNPKDFMYMFQPQIEAGSTEKPNSKGQKEVALELAQILGQFASASPAVVMIALKVLERSFPESAMNDEERAFLRQTIMMALQQAGAGPQGAQPAQEQGAEGQAPPEDEAALREQLAQEIASLPPEAQQELEQLVRQGVPPAEALQQVTGQNNG